MHQFLESKTVHDFLCLYCCCMHIQDFCILLPKQSVRNSCWVPVEPKNQLFPPNIWCPYTIWLCIYSSSDHLYWRAVGRYRPSILCNFKISKAGKSFICLFCCMDLLFYFLKFSKIWLLGFCEDRRDFGVCSKSEGGNLCSVAWSS